MEMSNGAIVRLCALASERIDWPAAEGIETTGDPARGWPGPRIAGTILEVAIVGENLAHDWDGCRDWYPDRTDEQLRAARDYFVAHRGLFQAQRWKDATYDRCSYPPRDSLAALQSDVAVLLTELTRCEAALAAATDGLRVYANRANWAAWPHPTTPTACFLWAANDDAVWGSAESTLLAVDLLRHGFPYEQGGN